MSEYTAKRARTRAHLLAAAQEMLPGAVRRGLEHSLGPGAVTQRAGLSRQTWYRYWRADDTGFLDELAHTSLASVDLLLEPLLAQLRRVRPARPVELLREVARAHFQLVSHRRIALVHLLVATLAVEDRFLAAEAGLRPTAAASILADHQRRISQVFAGLYGPLVEAWGRRPRPPLDLVQLVSQQCALADGYALRHVAHPESTSADDFATVTEALFLALTEPTETPPPTTWARA